MSWDQYNQTPASNDLSGYFATGMRPSAVKNAGWDIMADLAQFMSLPTSGGTANAQTVTNTRQFGALFTGMTQWFIPGNTNTGAVTLAIDGLTAKNVFANGVAAIAGMLASGVPALVKYDGTQWNLLNPQGSTGSYTGTMTGVTATITGTINYTISSDYKFCNVTIPGGVFTGTSNATTFTITGGPTIIAPASYQSMFALVRDNAVDGNQGVLSIAAASSVITFGKGIQYANGGFTASSAKGFAPAAGTSITFVYPLRP